MKIIIAAIKSWNFKNFQNLKDKHDYFFVKKKEDLVYEKILKINPDYIFFPHWSWFIPEDIINNFNCVVFHMTDLPYGRGGSPLQNLIVRGHKETKISALKPVKDFDAGPIYIKRNLSLEGTCDDILKRCSKIIFKDMIPFILENKLEPKPQEGKVIQFERRNPEDSNIENLKNIKEVYDHIRMLDGEEYPKAFVKKNKIVFELSDAKINKGEITAKVNIRYKK